MVLEVLGNGAVGSRIMRNASDYFHGFGSGLSSFSCLWKKVGGGREGTLCEDLVPGTFAVILIKLHHSATVCKKSAEIEILRHVFEARYYQVL